MNNVTKTVIASSAVGVIGIGAGIFIGTTALAPEPVVETKTVTETVEVAVTPQVCLEALDNAEAVIDVAVEGLTIVYDALSLVANGNVHEFSTKMSELDVLPAEETRAEYDRSAEECRAGRV